MNLNQAFSPVRALVRSFEAFRVAPVLLLLGGGLLFVLTALDTTLGVLFGDVSSLGDQLVGRPVSVLFTILFGGCCVKLVVQPLRAWVLGGFATTEREVALKRTVTLRTLFGPHPWLAVFVTSLLSSVVLSVVSMYLLATSVLASVIDTFFMLEVSTTLTLSLLISLVFLPILAWIWVALLPAPYIAALTGRSPMGALRLSWRWARGRRLRLLWFRIVTWLSSLSGVLLCGVGAIATWSIGEGAWVEAVREALDEDEAQRKAAMVASSAASIETSSE